MAELECNNAPGLVTGESDIEMLPLERETVLTFLNKCQDQIERSRDLPFPVWNGRLVMGWLRLQALPKAAHYNTHPQNQKD